MLVCARVGKIFGALGKPTLRVETQNVQKVSVSLWVNLTMKIQD